MPGPNDNLDALRSLYRAMRRIRTTEERLATRYSEQEIRCPMHLCIGQEAIAVGVSKHLTSEDGVFSNHRAHGHYLAKGGSLRTMLAELYGRETGCCGGRGGSMHLIDLDAGFMGATPIVGGTIPLTVGLAWSFKLRAEPRISVCFFGDGAFEEGVMHESMNFAALHKLPVLFICENNDFSVYTRLQDRQPRRDIWQVAAAQGLTAHAGDGNDVLAVDRMAGEAIARLRRGDGPQFLEFRTYRWLEHCGPNYDNDLGYRTMEEVRAGEADCPLKRISVYLDEASMKRIDSEIEEEVTAAFEWARSSPMPSAPANHVLA
jgi:TPP-dependent pyruvate/acetoin dehydrogenase alpha subunit